MSEGTSTNRLIHETSPYLLQHARNPVDWFPWGSEALELARATNRPIFLSIGYSACHWCHVMEHESFEDPATAKIMNEYFVNIKVDREERPDLDQIYMNAVQMLTGHGGWPMSVWLAPDLKPFHGGTYFPPTARHGMPAFRDVLYAVANAWQQRRGEVQNAADRLTVALREAGTVSPGADTLETGLITRAGSALTRIIDRDWGGIGRQPKFPHSVEMRLLLRAYLANHDQDARDLAQLTLDKMIHGGIYDQLGGGFHRYSTDQRWLVPHFEKMLYDNALIPLACLEAYQLSGQPRYARAAKETLDWLLREMTDANGAFYSTLDADSEGVEGKFYVWSQKEIVLILGERRATPFCYCYDVTPDGNWEDHNILNMPKTLPQCAKMLNMDESALENLLAECRQLLYQARAGRIWPGRDDKVLTSWNAMMIDTLAVAARVLRAPEYLLAARRAAQFLLHSMRDASGKLARTYKDGRARLIGYLEDYAYLANALVSLYEADFDESWLTHARAIVHTMIEQCWDEKDGGFFYTGKDHEALIARGKDPHDGAIPNGNGMAVTAMARLAKLTGDPILGEKTERTLKLFVDIMTRSPIAAAQMLIALGIHLGPTLEVAIVGDTTGPLAEETNFMLDALYQRFLPNKVVALRRVSAPSTGVALLHGKEAVEQRPTAYICQNFTCAAPIVGLADFQNALDLALKNHVQ